MCENFLNLISTCSNQSKQKLNSFLLTLFTPTDPEQEGFPAKLQTIFQHITQHITLNKVREISKSERNRKDLTNHQFNYGQITFRTIHQILTKIQKYRHLGSEEIFYDLGSGSGKVLFAASLCHPFLKCKGIELLQSLYTTSVQLKNKIEKERDYIEEQLNDISNKSYSLPNFQIFNEDFERMDWSDGTVIFVSSTCYTREVMHKISLLCDKLAPHTVLITLTRPIDSNTSAWRVKEKFEGQTSWGGCTVFIHLRDP